MQSYERNDESLLAQEAAFYGNQKHYCAVCEREIYTGEACYCFEGEAVCEDCCSGYVMDRYWYATPEDI